MVSKIRFIIFKYSNNKCNSNSCFLIFISALAKAMAEEAAEYRAQRKIDRRERRRERKQEAMRTESNNTI